MGAGYHGDFGNTKGKKERDKNLNKTIHKGRQEKHIITSKNYLNGRSIFNGTILDAEKLIDNFKGKGVYIGDNRERVDFGSIIGTYINIATGESQPTTIGIIHYSKDGAHIVPAKPRGGV